ncbi:uncharacterized protein DUF3558 [Amycolatopsis sulphurea]|uniref:Uncharacterized protein DUF3558 n=1 Tax=Amycolatopsis sulphurea TaxID=76022 RepID=A0A2A9FGC3_9PSEU|nr:DUF3558 domain-containing protein [Amycolatopsis sulphurea]PFG50208.1 uncharacterized protein DUF3558 [Amycolatopsis sulphurea]
MKRAAAVLAGAVFLVLAGCSGAVPGNAEPVAQAGSVVESRSVAADGPSGRQVSGKGVPKVEHPIDIGRPSRMPCAVLTAQQASELLGGVAPPKPYLDGAAGPSCYWGGDAAHGNASVEVIFPDIDKLGLTSVYQAAGGAYRFFRPLDPVNGYPIAAYSVRDNRSAGECHVALGVSDRQTVDLSVRQDRKNVGKKDPCDSARGIAEMVLSNIRGDT